MRKSKAIARSLSLPPASVAAERVGVIDRLVNRPRRESNGRARIDLSTSELIRRRRDEIRSRLSANRRSIDILPGGFRGNTVTGLTGERSIV